MINAARHTCISSAAAAAPFAAVEMAMGTVPAEEPEAGAADMCSSPEEEEFLPEDDATAMGTGVEDRRWLCCCCCCCWGVSRCCCCCCCCCPIEDDEADDDVEDLEKKI